MRISLVMVSPGVGGLQQSIIPYAVTLGAAGHHVQLLMHVASPLLHEARRLGFEPELVRGPHAMPLVQSFSARKKLVYFVPDAVIGFASKGYPLARLAAPKGVPVFTRVGTMDIARMRKLFRADGLIVTSEEMRALALSLGAKSGCVHVVPNFLIPRVPLVPTARELVRIGAMGRFVHRKGFDLLLDAAALLRVQGRRFELVIAGDGPELPNLQRQAARLDLDVQFPGWLSHDAKPGFFQELDIFACPSRDEPFGQIFLEAMQAGVAVVAADTVGARCIFTHEHNGLIARPEDPASMAQAMAALLDDREKRHALASAGAETFARHYHTGAAGGRLSFAIAELLKNQT